MSLQCHRTALLVLLATTGCGSSTVRYPSVRTNADIPPSTPTPSDPLRVHMYSGELYILNTWSESRERQLLSGSGTHYSVSRSVSTPGKFDLSVDSIALVEVTVRRTVRPAGPTILTVWGVLTGITTGVCVADPKACFGSCPTFYPTDSAAAHPWAEGFSGSIARSLEATDIDALYYASADPGPFELEMRNEALETHAVRSVRLLAVPRPATGRVLADGEGRFHHATRFVEPASCRGAEGDCLARVRSMDGLERRSLTDSADLAARETIELTFPAVPGPTGLVIGARHSLVSTYLFYQTMAFAGRSAGAWLARLERDGLEAFPGGFTMMDMLGGIEVELEQAGVWFRVAEYGEQGPIATDVQVIVLPETEDSVRIRLRLAKGNWRVDYLALAALGPMVEAEILEPVEVLGANGVADEEALERLRQPDEYLVTYPGDRYRLRFQVPGDHGPVELFLESRGYYYEWMRPEWLSDENPVMLALVGADPAAALKVLAPAFKSREAGLDEQFWASRFGGRTP